MLEKQEEVLYFLFALEAGSPLQQGIKRCLPVRSVPIARASLPLLHWLAKSVLQY